MGSLTTNAFIYTNDTLAIHWHLQDEQIHLHENYASYYGLLHDTFIFTNDTPAIHGHLHECKTFFFTNKTLLIHELFEDECIHLP